MISLVAWLDRLVALNPEDEMAQHLFRIVVPGTEPLDVSNWLVSIDPHGVLPRYPRASSPESLSFLRLLDQPGREAGLPERHRLGSDLASLGTLALGRRAIVVNDVGINVPQLGTVVFQPVGHIVDPSVLGPLPPAPKDRLETYLRSIAGLPEPDLAAISAASSAYHGAATLFDVDARAAYTLLVAGIEVLSRHYGEPPSDWAEWEGAASWDRFATEQGLTTDQGAALRGRLMRDRQLRLKATFQAYAATRLPDLFWDKPFERWIYGIRANDGQWLPASASEARAIKDVLPRDRGALQKALGLSYNLRSAVVHESDWVELITLAPSPAPVIDLTRPLPFMVLRLILAELIWAEIADHAVARDLPDFQLLRPGTDAVPPNIGMKADGAAEPPIDG